MKTKFSVGELLGVGLTLVVLGIGLAYGLEVMSDVRTDMGEDMCATEPDGYTSYNATMHACVGANVNTNTSTTASAEFNATNDAITGVAKIPEKLPTIATVIVASVIIGILVTYMWGRFAK